MAIANRLEIKQGQGLVMTPQLQQAIKILQLSNLELNDYINQELERNPALEREEEEFSEEASDEFAKSDDVTELGVSAEGDEPGASDSIDASYEDVYNDADIPAAESYGSQTDWSSAGSGRSYDELDSLESTLAQEVSLRDHLETQANLAFENPQDKMIAAYLIDSIDDGGYLRIDGEEVARNLGIDEEKLEDIIAVLQTFDPIGVCARNVKECLAAQLHEKKQLDEKMALLLDNLDMLAKHDLRSLCHILEVDGEDLAGMIGKIRSLTPKPGASFGSTSSDAITPDVFVREAPNGLWVVELNTENLPKVLVNNSYCEMVSRHARTEDEKSYITECQNEASWLVKSLDQRARTILKVAREIVRQQDGFLTYGVSHLRPLVLKDVANVIDMHESTVSRVTSNKYISTPRGVFELKYFFTTSISSSYGGEAHSSESVRYQIKTLIDEEPVLAPLSDDAIVDILKQTGIDIARRTVAKYREAMRIPSSVTRKRQKSF
ncbi:RNA polymerase factor sigma-54 [Pseudaquidulcibacter saccharophilus]|uniref:RNA polymerase factor sigma-54 n=1 Tax=Pseudaquidulcibacter saccharophilus TaxID=2831900 RepID=UPI001EFF491D|nr:RNA polymerase factor sigma-54 [Pseudaquidulcibacter saccharophilus]